MNRIPMADQLSILRVLLTVLVIGFSIFGLWVYAAMYLAMAWVTDLLDGHFAREYGSWRDNHPDLDMDGLADSALAFGSSLVIVGYAWFSYSQEMFWLLAGLYILTVISGGAMASVMNRPNKKRWMVYLIAVNMIVFHGVVQIFGTGAWFAYMAFGWPGVIATLVVALPVVWLQRHKMQLWLAGKFS